MKIQLIDIQTSKYALYLSFIIVMFIGYQLPAQDIQILLPTQYDGKANSKQLQYDETFYIYKAAVSSRIDLKKYKQYQREATIPDSVHIILPEMPNAMDTTLLIGFIRAKATDPGRLVLLLATDYTTNEVTFYIDTNLDGNYNNDERPIMILAGTPPVKIELLPLEKDPLYLYLGVPKQLSQEEKRAAIIKDLKRGTKKKIYNKLSLGFYGGVGIGQLTYDYDNVDSAYPTWYEVRFSEKNIGVNLNYETAFFRFGLNAAFMNHFYYTSYLNIRFAEPRGIRTGVLTERNIDSHSLNRVQIDATAAFKIRLSDYSDVQPFVSFGQLFYLSDSYFSDNRPNKEVSYALSPNYYYELGIRLDFTVGNEKTLFFDLVSNQLQWRPDNFLEGINLTNLGITHRTWKINVGYKIGL